jgi:hypothetical protein
MFLLLVFNRVSTTCQKLIQKGKKVVSEKNKILYLHRIFNHDSCRDSIW